jgi:hypothetical protein
MKKNLLFTCIAILVLFPCSAYTDSNDTARYQTVPAKSTELSALPVQSTNSSLIKLKLNQSGFSDEETPLLDGAVALVNQYRKADASGILTDTDFHSHASRPRSSLFPQLNGDFFYDPVASDDKDFPQMFLDIVSNDVYSLDGIEFVATFKGAAVAPNPYDEMVFFVTDDISNWTSQEYGVRCSLKDNVIYGYVQDGNGKAGGCSFFKNVPLGTGDGIEHTYKIIVQNLQSDHTFKFYIDNNLAGTITHSSFLDYTAQTYYIVMTTHRWESGWDSTGLGMSIKNICVQTVSPKPILR